LLCLTVLFFFLNVASGQSRKSYSKHNLMAELKMQYGFLMSHHLELDIFQSHFPAFEFSIQKATWGKQMWESMYGYPIVGIAFWYSPIGGFDELGSAYAVYPFINFPLVQDEKQSFNFRLGLGLGYLTNNFDRLENYKNFAIGSSLNVAGSLYFEYRRKFGEIVTLSGGLGLTHFSNGSMKTPNYGLNIITATVGFSAYLKRPNPQLSKKLRPELYTYEFDGRKTLDFDVGFALGIKDMSQQLGQRFMVYCIYTNLFFQVSYKSKFGIGLDLTYDNSDKYIIEWQGGSVDNTIQLFKPGISAAYQLVLGRLSFVFNFGVYLAGLERSEGDLYQRLTFRYLFTDNIFANIALNSNWGKAEYIGFGIGYQLNFIYKRTVKHSY